MTENEEAAKSEADYERAQQEWNLIKPLPIINLSDSRSNAYANDSLACGERVNDDVLDLEAITSYIAGLDVSEELKQIKPVVRKRGFVAFLRRIFWLNPPEVRATEERDRIFAVAMKALDSQDSMHTRFLTTIFHKLTRQPLIKCPRYGNHWEEIGFQGTDPATDLRGVGLLGLYQILFLVLSDKTAKLAQEIFCLSLDKRQQFPFCVMSTNITQIALQVLREGHLNKALNKRTSDSGSGAVVTGFNLFYAGLFLKLYKTWKDGKKTITDAGFVLKEIRTEASKSVANTIERALNHDSSSNNSSSINNSRSGNSKKAPMAKSRSGKGKNIERPLARDGNEDMAAEESTTVKFSDLGNVFSMEEVDEEKDSDTEGHIEERAIM